MATEALATDRTAEWHAEEVKLTNDIKDDTIVSSPETKDLDEKDEEKIKVDDSASEEASATESKPAIVSEEKLEDKSEPQAEVKIDSPVSESHERKDSEAGDASKEKQEEEKSEFVAEEVKKEEVKDETYKQEVDFLSTDSKEEPVSSAAVEPTVEAVIPEPAKLSIEALAADLESDLVQDSESETAKEPTILEAGAEEANATEELQQVSSEPVTEPLFAFERVKEPSVSVTDVKETEPSMDSKDLSEQEELSGDVSETPVKELKDEGESAVVAEEVPIVPEFEKVVQSASIAEEEMPEKAVVAEEPTVTDTAKSDVEKKKDESLEGKNATLVETSRDIDVQEGKNNVNTEADNLVSNYTEEGDEKTPVEPAEDIAAAAKMEVRSKSSRRQSNSMFSKLKQSIVKVKKAIIGKSPSSKTISSEAKDEVKVKQLAK